MKKPRRKKYLSGSPINGVIPNPQDVLAENQIMQAKAQYAAETNPWIMGLETVAGIGMGILGNSNFAQNGFQPRQKSLAGQPVNQQAWGNFNNNPWGQNPNQTMYAAYGGMVPQQVPIEAEGGELAQTPDGQMMGFQGTEPRTGRHRRQPSRSHQDILQQGKRGRSLHGKQERKEGEEKNESGGSSGQEQK